MTKKTKNIDDMTAEEMGKEALGTIVKGFRLGKFIYDTFSTIVTIGVIAIASWVIWAVATSEYFQ